jgi:hypothetical protein
MADDSLRGADRNLRAAEELFGSARTASSSSVFALFTAANWQKPPERPDEHHRARGHNSEHVRAKTGVKIRKFAALIYRRILAAI